MAEANQTAQSDAQELPRSTPYLLGLVIFLGVAIIACLAVLVITIIMRVSADDEVDAAGPAGQSRLLVDEMVIPNGAQLISVTPFDRHLLLRVQDGSEAIIIVYDPRDGMEKRRLRLKNAD